MAPLQREEKACCGDYFVGALLPNDRDPAGPNVPLR